MVICGQRLSVFPDFAQFLVEPGIDVISVTPEPLLKTKRANAEVDPPSPRPWRIKNDDLRTHAVPSPNARSGCSRPKRFRPGFEPVHYNSCDHRDRRFYRSKRQGKQRGMHLVQFGRLDRVLSFRSVLRNSSTNRPARIGRTITDSALKCHAALMSA